MSVSGNNVIGAWSGTGDASVGSTGVVTGVSGGSASVMYTVSNSCGTAVAIAGITVNPLPDVPVISGPSSVNAGSSIMLTASVGGGTWSSTGNISVNASGSVYGTADGAGAVTYTVTNSCGTRSATKMITVNPSGFLSICVGSTHQFTASGSGTWVNGSEYQVSLSTDGLVTGMNGGWATVYFVPDDGSAVIEYDFGVMQDPAVSEIEIFGYFNPLQLGQTTYVSAIAYGCQFGTLGESWSYSFSSNDPSVVSITPDGYITAVAPGFTTINYAVTNICGSGVGHGFAEVMHPLDITGGSPCDLAHPDDICICVGVPVIVQSVRGEHGVNADWTSGNTGVITVTHLDGENIATLIGWTTGSTDISAIDEFGNIKTRHVNVIAPPAIPIISGDPGYAPYFGNSVTVHGDGENGHWLIPDASPYASAVISGGDITVTNIISWATDTTYFYGIFYKDSNMCGYNIAAATVELNHHASGAKAATGATPATIAAAGSAQVFPNPTTGSLNIQWLSRLMGMAEMVITDVTGRVVYKDAWEMTANSGKKNADLSGLASGVYFVTIKSADINYSTRITLDK